MSRKMHSANPATYLECLDQIPPAYCRLIAREAKQGRWHRILTITQIAEAAGLSWQKTAAIARRKSFAGVTVEDADKFRRGCGITLANEQMHMKFIRRNLKNDASFKNYFKYSKDKWSQSHWRTKFINRILKRL